ncbi:Uncharacterized protein HZ326_23848 [Fusarium oxysporum f. sp. albedinis]|nr:Uncharacterized protein HZ326_23848 [Fusarium oxysporum f. sp. albedinis]
MKKSCPPWYPTRDPSSMPTLWPGATRSRSTTAMSLSFPSITLVLQAAPRTLLITCITSGLARLNVVDTRPALGFHGGVGDDLWLAGAGKLGDETKKDIIAETPTILKAFEFEKRVAYMNPGISSVLNLNVWD